MLGRTRLEDLAVIHEHHTISHLTREAHLVRHPDHRAVLLGQLDHHVEDLVDHLGV